MISGAQTVQMCPRSTLTCGARVGVLERPAEGAALPVFGTLHARPKAPHAPALRASRAQVTSPTTEFGLLFDTLH